MMIEKLTKFFLPALNKNEDTVEHTGEINVTVSFLDSYSGATTKNDNEEDFIR